VIIEVIIVKLLLKAAVEAITDRTKGERDEHIPASTCPILTASFELRPVILINFKCLHEVDNFLVCFAV
jgi:hypothetical protein